VRGDGFALAVATIWSLHPVALLLARGYLSSLAWFALAVTVVVERMLAVEQGRERRPWLTCGLALGASAWIEPLMGPVALAWIVLSLAFRRPHARAALLAGIVAALVIAPWCARNAVMFGTPSPRATGAPEMWLGALAGPGEETPIRMHPSRNRVELEHLAAVGERAFNREKLDATRALIAADPVRWAGACAWRLGNFWLGRLSWWRASPDQPIVAGPLSALRGALHAGLALFALAGLIAAWRSVPATRLIALVLAVYPLVYALTHVEARYRLPIEPLLALSAALLLPKSALPGSFHEADAAERSR